MTDIDDRVHDSDDGDGWRFVWQDKRGRGYWDLEWLPNKEQWVRGFRAGNIGAWSQQPVQLEQPFSHDDARRIAMKHADGME